MIFREEYDPDIHFHELKYKREVAKKGKKGKKHHESEEVVTNEPQEYVVWEKISKIKGGGRSKINGAKIKDQRAKIEDQRGKDQRSINNRRLEKELDETQDDYTEVDAVAPDGPGQEADFGEVQNDF